MNIEPVGGKSGLVNALNRTLTLADVSLRDYFSTFAVYATATSLLLAATSFLVGRLPHMLIGLVAVLGLWVCLQWHIATFGTRLTYRYYLEMSKYLREEATMETPPLFDASLTELPWSGRQHRQRWGVRGAGLPVVYGTVFLAILLNAVHPLDNGNAMWMWAVFVSSIVLFLGFNEMVWRERNRDIKWPYWRDPTG